MYIFFTGLTRRRSAADLGATPSFHRLLSRPVALGNPLGSPWGPLGDLRGTHWGTLGTPWGSLGDLLGILGDLLGTLGDPLGTTWGPSRTSWGALGTPWRSHGNHLPVLLEALCASWTFFGTNLAPQGTPRGSQQGSGRPLAGLLGAFWRLRKRLRSDSLQYAQTFKFSVRYCKNRGSERLKSFKITCIFFQCRGKTIQNRNISKIRSKIFAR